MQLVLRTIRSRRLPNPQFPKTYNMIRGSWGREWRGRSLVLLVSVLALSLCVCPARARREVRTTYVCGLGEAWGFELGPCLKIATIQITTLIERCSGPL